MVGHSGTGPEAERLVEWSKPPRTDKERLEIAKTMEAVGVGSSGECSKYFYIKYHQVSYNGCMLNKQDGFVHALRIRLSLNRYTWGPFEAKVQELIKDGLCRLHVQFEGPCSVLLSWRPHIGGSLAYWLKTGCYNNLAVQATMRAIMEIGSQEADERLVLVVSDADLQRYNIDVRCLGNEPQGLQVSSLPCQGLILLRCEHF